jgi:hypothetical protein
MKKNTIILGFFIASLGFTSCNSSNQEKENSTEQKSENKIEDSSDEQMSVDEIDKLRAEIESLNIKPIEISTSNLKEKTKQKWSKIHFYVKDNVVLKVKTYPYSEISKRTEEFYTKEGSLALVVIEDNGDGVKGKPKSEIDKMYYYNKGKLIKEIRNQKEPEQAIKEIDAEELMVEFNEYLQIYKAIKK